MKLLNYNKMKTIKITLALTVSMLAVLTGFAQKKVTGIVYKDGKPAAGIVVEAHKSSGSFYTSFDGLYEVTISPKSKYITFSYGEDSKRLDLDGTEGDVINFSYDGSPIPDDGGEPGVILKSLEELQKDRDVEFLNNYSLYREFFKQDDFKSCEESWRKLYKTYPKSSLMLYNDGVKLFENKIANALNPNEKVAYLDTIAMIYDKRIKYFGNTGDPLSRKARIYLELILPMGLSEADMIKGVKKGYEYADAAITALGNKAHPSILVLKMQSSKKLFSVGQMTKADVLENYASAMTILEKELEDPDLKELAELVIPNITQIIESSGALDCASISELYTPKFEQTPDDIDMLRKIIAMSRREDCTDSELYIKVSEKLYELQPSAESALNMAHMFVKLKDNEKAQVYYKEACDKESDAVKKATNYYEASMLALQMSKVSLARDYAREAIKLNAEYCEAYILMGEIYAQAGRTIEGSDFEKNATFWLAVDYYEKASRFDSCKETALGKVKFYSGYFPNKEDVFFLGFSVGDRYQVGGWINEGTKIRVK